MDEIKKLLESMQLEIRQQKTDLAEMKEDIKNTIINNINEKFSNLEKKNAHLERKIEEQSTVIQNFERYMRRKNLILFGVAEQEKSYHELQIKIIDIINTHFNLNFDSNNIEAVRRLGKKSDKTRPVIITFSTLGLKISILKNKKILEDTPYYLKEDYPLEVLNKRKELQEQLKNERELGKKAFIRYDKLIILNNKNEHTFRSHKNKRNLSESPETYCTDSQIDKNSKKQPLKRNRTTNMKDFVTQTPKHIYKHTGNSQDRHDSTPRSIT